MYRRLGEAVLKSGERLEIGVVEAPDPGWLPRLAPFLGHKNADYRAHIERALSGPLDRLQTRFYVGSVDGALAGQIMVVGDRGTGILGHVFTRPQDRRKGVCAAIMARQMEDCAAAGFRVLCLGTGYDTPPYHIYHSFGFRGIAQGSGCMKWLAEPDAERTLLRPGAASVRELRWDDWAYFDLLGFQPAEEEELPRSSMLGLAGQGSLEGPFVTLLMRREREPGLRARVLVSDSGATVGWMLLGRDPRWFGSVWLLDAYAHPGFTDRLPDLLAGLDWPDAPVAAYLTRPEGPRAAALAGAGLHRVADLPGWLPRDGGRADLAVWRRG